MTNRVKLQIAKELVSVLLEPTKAIDTPISIEHGYLMSDSDSDLALYTDKGYATLQEIIKAVN